MESEVELHETIQEMHAVATVPDLYPIMVELQAVPSLLEILAHENTDIAVAVVDLLQVSVHVSIDVDLLQVSVHMCLDVDLLQVSCVY
jgi:beta-catenin-like protein 1